MAEFPEGGPREDLAASGEVAKLDQLDSVHYRRERPSSMLMREPPNWQLRRAGYLRRLPEVAP